MTRLSQTTCPRNDRAAVQKPITPAEIELINAHGPYNQSVWRGRGITVSHEEGLTGRIEFLSGKVRETILKHLSKESLAHASILDIGCCDGWLLESLSDLPFQRMVGIEPRRENVERGRRVREILGIPSHVHYQLGEIDTLDDAEMFDIVLCMGVIHHLESIHASLSKLRKACKKLLIVDTLCLSSGHLTADLKRDVELKDLVYRYKPPVFGITAQKYEGQYYPGSGVRFAVVNVPTVESVKMHLDVLGFQNITVVADWEDYRRAVPRNHRPIQEVCLCATVGGEEAENGDARERRWIEDYERRMTTAVLPDGLIVPLYQCFFAETVVRDVPPEAKLIHRALTRGVVQEGGEFGPPSLTNATAREIMAALPHCPVDKIRLEYAKYLLAQGAAGGAIDELLQVTRRPSADWRSCYRAFYLLWRAHLLRDDPQAAHRYREFCLKCNPNFPIALFADPPPLQAVI